MRLLELGGFFMIPLLICSVLTLAIIGERIYVYATTLKERLIDWEEPEEVIKDLRRHLMTLYTIIVIAPMLGLIGTVIGLMKSFHLLGQQVGNYNPKLLSSGISEALITTATGLVIAVVATIFYNYFHSRLEEYVADYNNDVKKEQEYGHE
ncbi:outer membrane transport energization protein ExbB [Hydrogenispora ethanolica]|jgi:biopolymer transport protein ExbB/TolQ|uniref:Outer membrane transport energization protein ExbB n=1 Tax=Hydrogenispora ethanolica TaxID=1082276 RepID=A0A4R1RIH7_HYDET|nr:MotA/TolQ/ExbB proton channel family protein [Hydrogenispora ethanolica]TCL65905.1 outer membrane transport energization protein ExbB [Hydrogenispora ethanolica]